MAEIEYVRGEIESIELLLPELLYLINHSSVDVGDGITIKVKTS